MFNRKYIFLKGSVFQPAMLVDGSVYDWEQSSLLTLQLSTGFILQGLEYTAHIMCLVGGCTSHLTSLLTVYPSNWRHAICSAMDESLLALLRTIVPRKLNTLKKKWKKKHSFFPRFIHESGQRSEWIRIQLFGFDGFPLYQKYWHLVLLSPCSH